MATINSRRQFIGTMTGSAAMLSLGSMFAPFAANAEENPARLPEDADAWFNKVKGKHRIVFDNTEATHGVFSFAWPKVFLLTNAATGSPGKDCTAVVILRHDSIAYAMQDSLWEKYKFKDRFGVPPLGPVFRAADAATATDTRNPFWNTKSGDFVVPGFGEVPIGIKELQADGVMFCVCDAALTVNSAVAAMQTNGKAEAVKKEWIDGLIPGIQVVPSGVWAVGRAQEHGCAYCFVG